MADPAGLTVAAALAAAAAGGIASFAGPVHGVMPTPIKTTDKLRELWSKVEEARRKLSDIKFVPARADMEAAQAELTAALRAYKEEEERVRAGTSVGPTGFTSSVITGSTGPTGFTGVAAAISNVVLNPSPDAAQSQAEAAPAAVANAAQSQAEAAAANADQSQAEAAAANAAQDQDPTAAAVQSAADEFAAAQAAAQAAEQAATGERTRQQLQRIQDERELREAAPAAAAQRAAANAAAAAAADAILQEQLNAPLFPKPAAPEDKAKICAAAVPADPVGNFTEIKQDGWCYYNAILAANREEYTDGKAKLLVDAIRTELADLTLRASVEAEWKKLKPDQMPFQLYVDNMHNVTQPEFWGEGLILSPVVAKIKNRVIAIYNKGSDGVYIKNDGQVFCPPEYADQSVLSLAFNGTNHYDAFVGVEEDISSVASSLPLPAQAQAPVSLGSASSVASAPAPAPVPADTTSTDSLASVTLSQAGRGFVDTVGLVRDAVKRVARARKIAMPNPPKRPVTRSSWTNKEINAINRANQTALDNRRKQQKAARDERLARRASRAAVLPAPEPELQAALENANVVAAQAVQARRTSGVDARIEALNDELVFYLDWLTQQEAETGFVPTPRPSTPPKGGRGGRRTTYRRHKKRKMRISTFRRNRKH